MPTIKELGEKRGNLQSQAQEIINRAETEDRDLHAEEKEAFEKIHKEDCELRDRINRLEEMDKWDDELNSVPDPGNAPSGFQSGGFQNPSVQYQQAAAINAWCSNKLGEIVTPQQQEACDAAGINLNSKYLELKLLDSGELSQLRQNTLITTDPSKGGVSIQPTFINNLERAMLAVGAFLSEVDEMRTDRGEQISIPTENDTSNEGVQVGEGQTNGDGTEPAFGDVKLNAYKMSSKFIKVSHEMVRDSGFNMLSYVSTIMGERLGRTINRKATNGTGAATVTGIMSAAKQGYEAAGATAITYDDLVRLKHSVDPSYRANARWMFHDDVLLALKLLKDSEGRPLWKAGISGGDPDTVDNQPIVINQHMETIAANNKSVLYGNLKKYKLRKVRTIRIRHMTERFGENDEDGFIGFIEVDGNLLDAGTNPVKYLVHPAS